MSIFVFVDDFAGIPPLSAMLRLPVGVVERPCFVHLFLENLSSYRLHWTINF